MSVVPLDSVKADLRLVHDADDGLLQTLLDASEDEAARYLGLPGVAPEDFEDGVTPPSVVAAVFLLVRAKYDEADPAAMRGLRACAETLLTPYRVNMGV